MSRRAPPLESFAPELRLAWQKSSLSTIKIKVENRAQATSLRHRLYKLRMALKDANDPLYQTAQYGTIRIEPEATGAFFVILEPADSSFKAAFKEAGLDLDLDVPPLDLEL